MKRRLALAVSLAASGAALTAGCASNSKPGRGPIVSVVPAETPFLVNVDAEGVALAGHDAVAFFTQGAPVKGDPRFRSAYKGAYYQFASADHKALFDANPMKYEPQFGGFCGYAASINKVSPVDVKYWEIIDGRLVLQHNQKAWDLWHKDVAGNLRMADRNWPSLTKDNGI